MVAADGETRRGDRVSRQFLSNIWKKRTDRPKMLEVSLLGVGRVLRLGRDAWSTGK